MATGLKKTTWLQLGLVLITALTSHWITKSHYETKAEVVAAKGRVTGIGGIFFKTDDPVKLKQWYEDNMGFKTNQYGTVFEYGKLYDNNKRGFLQWSPFSSKTNYFEGELMINYRVVNLEAMLEDMRAKGVEIVDTLASYDYGKFVHIRDIAGNKIELWEPIDSVYATYDDGSITR